MTPTAAVLERLRASSMRLGDVRFAALGGPLEAAWRQAVDELGRCILPLVGDTSAPPVLNEGGVYLGSWLESTATINAEVLDRFEPDVTRDTHLAFAANQRDDGLLPYKLTADGPGYAQIQMVTPFARSVWHHYLAAGRDRDYLATMYRALARHDDWLAAHRDTRGTGGVEAFCTFDTGHDRSPRFWGVPDQTPRGDAAAFDPESGVLPFLAPDLTANVACQRASLARIAEELGEDPAPWRAKAAASLAALEACFDEHDGCWYDVDAAGRHVRVQSDVLIRVLACEVGDAEFFAASLERYLLNSRKFFSAYPFTSLALDDPRFDHDFRANSWGGPVNFLTLIRAPHAFEHHGHVAELAFSLMPVVAAVARMGRFPQVMSPWTGEPGYTEQYSPAILWLLDTVERLFGILPRPDGELWFTGLMPRRVDHHDVADLLAYERTVDGVRFELVNTATEAIAFRDGEEFLRMPHGLRAITDRTGRLTALVGMTARPVAGTVRMAGGGLDVEVAGNERVELDGLRLAGRSGPGVVLPRA